MKMRSALGILLALAAHTALAQVTDPTQPPAALQAPAASQPGQPAEAPPRAAQLQSILVSPTRRVAVIDGETVRVGQDFHGARVALIGEIEVVLLRGKEKEVLKLFGTTETAALPEKRNSQ
jgi:MSHA biogenesis protein MshK